MNTHAHVMLPIVVACALSGLASATPVVKEETKRFAVALPREQLMHRQMELVGTIDGKTYYADRADRVDWESANLICWFYGLKLASVTSAAQHNLLTANLEGGYYWIGARDALDEREVVWQDTDGPVTRYGGPPGLFNIHTAVSFHTPYHIDLEPLNIGNFVLCETN